MKETFRVFIAILFFMAGTALEASSSTTLKGSIKGYKGQEMGVMLDLEAPGVEIKPAVDGSFEVKLNVTKPTYGAILTIGEEYLYHIYLEPNGNYVFNADISTDDGESKNYTMQGSNAKENSFLKNFVFGLHRSYILLQELYKYDSYKDYNSHLSQVVNTLQSELNSTKNASFIAHFGKRITQRKVFFELSYEFVQLAKSVEEKQSIEEKKVDPEYLVFIKSPAWTSVSDSTFIELQDIFNSYAMSSFKDIGTIAVLKTLGTVIPKQAILNTYATMIANNYYAGGGGTDNPEDVFNTYQAICTDKSAIENVRKAKQEAIAFMPGAAAMNFDMKDQTGKIVNLSDLKGKAVYIDVWATWCGPCKAEIPYFEKLVEHYKGDDRITFISISVDAKEDAWKKMIKEQAHSWPQYIVNGDFKSDLCKNYKIDAIPRFLMFDKDGKVVNVSAPRPSDKNIISYIDAVL